MEQSGVKKQKKDQKEETRVPHAPIPDGVHRVPASEASATYKWW